MIQIMAKEEQIKNIKDLIPSPRVGSLVEGKVAARSRSALFVDIGIQGTGVVYGREFYQAKEMIKNLNIGDSVFAKVIEMENEDGYRELSLRSASEEANWKKLGEMKLKGEMITVKIAGVNKGGLLTNVHGTPAFLPVSQLSPENYPRVADADKQKILRELQKFIGKEMEVKVLDISPEENKLILSEKAKEEQAIKKMLESLNKGDVVRGTITGIADFGAFMRFRPLKTTEAANDAENNSPLPEDSAAASLPPVTTENDDGNLTEQKIEPAEENETPDSNAPRGDLPVRGTQTGLPAQRQTGAGEVEGLIHVSELDWQMIQHPSEVVKIGEVIMAQVIDIKNNHVFLSLKNLRPNPWEKIGKEYKREDKIKGKVVALNPFGAFVEVMPKIRGLCHISEFGSQEAMKQALKIGETYEFEILLIDPKDHKINLRLIGKLSADIAPAAQINTDENNK